MKLLPFLFIGAVLTAFGCKQNNQQYDKDYPSHELSDSASATGLTGDSVKLVKTASIHFKVKEVEKSTKAISEAARKFGGAVHYQSFRSPQTGRKELQVSDDSLMVITTLSPQADLTVRVPSINLETFLFEVTELGYHTEDILLKIDDKSLLYLENDLRRKNRISAVRTKRPKPDSTINWQTLRVKDETVAQYIANKTIDAEAAYSTIQLSLFQNAIVNKELIANYAINDYQLPLSTRIGQSFYKGWEAFLSLVVALLHLWPFALLGVGLYFAYRIFQRRKVAGSTT